MLQSPLNLAPSARLAILVYTTEHESYYRIPSPFSLKAKLAKRHT
jgi:hypothetical protein